MKFSIKWNKAPPSGIAGKVEFFDIELRQNYGLLEDDYAQVKSHFSYALINGRTDLRVRTVIGNPKEVTIIIMKELVHQEVCLRELGKLQRIKI